MAKKKHWTQTREGKKKLKAALKKHWKTRRAKTDEEFAEEDFDQSNLDIEVEKPPKRRLEVAAKPKDMRTLLEDLFDQTDALQATARGVADILGIEL